MNRNETPLLAMRKPSAAPLLFIFLCSLVFFSGCGDDDLSTILGGGDSPKKYSVSGTISAADNSAIDSDVNDILAPFAPNDDFGTAQNLPNPAVVGGYVNTTGFGESGRFYDPKDATVLGDVSDFFTARLTENQSITLYIADYGDAPFDVDIDLYLYDAGGNPVQASEGSGPSETVAVAAAGMHYIEVRALWGASNYILTIGRPAIEATLTDERLQEAFVGGEVLVSFKQNPSEETQSGRSLQNTPCFGMQHTSGGHGSIQLFSFDAQSRDQVFAALDIQTPETHRYLYQTEDEPAQLKLDTLRVIQALKKRPDIRYAEPNYYRYPLFSPDDTYYSRQWHYPLMNLPQAWDITRGSAAVVVAVIDTGILTDHPDIKGQLIPGKGYDFISSPSIALDGDGIDSDPEDPGDDMQGGSSFHGTHVAGTIAAATNNAKGVAGVSPEAKIMALRVLGKGGGTSADIIQALRYAAGLNNASNTLPANKADIVNMSLGGSSWSQAEQETITAVRNQGVIVVAAAGNSSSSLPSYPAAYDGVVSVSAVDAAKNLAPYSNFGATIDVAAPGGNLSKDFDNDGFRDGVLSTSGDDSSGSISYGYSFSNGTSMAAPHMAGVVALMKSVFPALTPELLDLILADGNITEDIGISGRDDQYGHGLIDAYKAVTAATDDIPTMLIVSPLSLNFQAFNSELFLKAQKISANDEPIMLLPPVADVDWLSIFPDNVDADGFGTYAITVDRSGLPDGPYYATLSFDSDQNDINVPVAMQVGDITATGDAGFHYVLLLKLEDNTLTTVDQLQLAAKNGAYPFTFSSVPAGRYIVFAGTDSDNDYFIGDPGEAIGAFISLDQPVAISLQDHISGIDFATAFNLKLPADFAVFGSDSIGMPFPLSRKHRQKVEQQ